LIAKGVGQLAMLALHLVVRQVDFGFTGAVRGDLRGTGATPVNLREVSLNLLPPGTRGFEVRGRVAVNLRLSVGAALKGIAQRLEPGRELRPIDGCGEGLRSVEFSGLERAGLTR
jgi:hypothetical protein